MSLDGITRSVHGKYTKNNDKIYIIFIIGAGKSAGSKKKLNLNVKYIFLK